MLRHQRNRRDRAEMQAKLETEHARTAEVEAIAEAAARKFAAAPADSVFGIRPTLIATRVEPEELCPQWTPLTLNATTITRPTPQTPESATTQATPAKPRKGKRHGTVNARMLELLSDNPDEVMG